MPCSIGDTPSIAQECAKYSQMSVKQLKETRYNGKQTAFMWYRDHLIDDLRQATSELTRLLTEEEEY